MINHVRTRLLNLPAAGAAADEVYIPPAFVQLPLPAVLRAARAALLGDDQTRSVLCVRVDRLMTYAHNCPLAADLLAADARITYDPDASTGTQEADGVHAFAAAVDGSFDAVFKPANSDAEARWYQTWKSAEIAPTRAVALALATVARVSELAGG